jgi:hypothetical protein
MANINNDKLEEIKGYYQDGFSVREISEKIQAPFNATFYFLRKHKIPRRTARESNALQFAKKQLSFSIKENLSVEEEKLKIAALMLYWGEGAKRGHTVDLANSDISVIKIFLRFLREICRVDESRLRVYTYCYINQNIDKILEYWSIVTKISKNQFSQPYIRNDFSMKAGRQMEFGMIHIRYNDKKLLNYILKEIEDYRKEFIK